MHVQPQINKSHEFDTGIGKTETHVQCSTAQAGWT